MTQITRPASVTRVLAAAILGCAGVTAAANARDQTVTYVLDDVWLLPDVSHPGGAAQPLTGSFAWTYQAGDFENGTGALLDLDLPWFSAKVELASTIEPSSIEITLEGNYHDLGVDVTLHLLEPLTLNEPSPIDTVRSAFEIQQGISRQGHVITGSVVPVASPCPADLDGDGAVAFTDLLVMLASWGPCGACAADLDASGAVDFNDLLLLLSGWGSCPA